MKYCFAVICMLVIYPIYSREQSFQSLMSVDSQSGYSTNPYLNSWVGVWNTSLVGAYWLVAPDLQVEWYQNGNSLTGSMGGFFQPYLGNGNFAYGGVTYFQFQRNFSYHWQANITTGGQLISSQFGRSLGWVQSHVNWIMSPISELTLNLGTTFIKYSGLAYSNTSAIRFDSYGFQFETWPLYHWRINLSVYGDLDNIGKPSKNITTQLAITHLWNNGSELVLSGSIGQYENEINVINGSNGSTNIPTSTVTQSVKNHLYNFRLQGEYPLTNHWSLTGSIATSSWTSSLTSNNQKDFQTSVGARWYFYPKIGRQSNDIKPQWYQKGMLLYFRVHYSGQGRLFIVGDFDNWSKPGKPLIKQTDNTYTTVLRLKPGVYEYKILAISGSNTHWLKLAHDVSTIPDGFGGVNGRFIVDMSKQ